MPRYHFHIHESVSEVDAEGTDLPDLTAARREALRRAGHRMVTSPDTLMGDNEWHLEVTDAAGTLLFSLELVTSIAPGHRGTDD